jgi:argininosuccinate lyase
MTNRPDGESQPRETLWQKGSRPNEWVIKYTVGDDYVWDTALLPFDVRATRAHIHGLGRIGVVTEEEIRQLDDALDKLLIIWRDGEIGVAFEDEDCHTVIERFLTSEVGPAGAKVHTGRSRNDQVLAALRLYERDTLRSIAHTALDLSEELLHAARRLDSWLMPGYTHTQRAMPTSVGQWYGGFAETILEDVELVIFAANAVNKSPLGSGAGYGIPHIQLDRVGVAESVFEGRLIHNSTAVQLSRGKAEALAVTGAAQVALTMNRLASDLTLFASQDFGFIEFPESVTTGSSIMPHKKNPDVLEIARATFHRVNAELSLLMSVGANLTSGYHRDLQLTKGATMRALGATQDTLDAMSRFVPHVSFNRARLDAAVSAPMLTAGNALKSVLEGQPFRDAYRSNTQAEGRPGADEILATYKTAGSPGRTVVELLLERVSELRRRLAEP